MSPTIKEDAAIRMLLNSSSRDLAAAEDILRSLRTPDWPPWLRNVIAQSSWGKMPPHEVLMSARLVAWLYEGGGYVRIELGCGPGPDRDVEGNNEKLKALGRRWRADDPSDSATFEASFRGGYGDADGHVAWDKTIRVEVAEKLVPFSLEPAQAPLEVGRVRAWQLWFHLVRHGVVARWPYGDDAITILALRHDYWSEHVAARFEETPRKARSR